ncbi:MAG: hypothetical protein ACOCNS_00320 [Bacteroidales bacterium]
MGISRAALACQPVAQLGAFWRNGTKSISLHQRKEEEHRLFLFLRFWGKQSYMSGKIILYDRENYKQGRKNLLLYDFHDVLLSENSLDFRVFFSGQISLFLIIPKLSRRAALTIVNAPETLCAGRGAALRIFVFSGFSTKGAKGLVSKFVCIK